MSKHSSGKPVEIKISTVVAVAVILRTAELSIVDTAVRELTGGVSDYFENEFAVIDIGSLGAAGAELEWSGLIDLLRRHRLNPVAVRNVPAGMEEQVLAHGLSIDATGNSRQEAASPQKPPAPPPPAPVSQPVQAVPPAGSLIIDSPVRAGQRIYARGSDLVVTAIVNNGAELIADGSIHIYAPLRGRALAGASGNAESRIFTLSMEAELVSIAGIYRTFDQGLPKEMAKKPAQIRLAGDRIDVLSIND